MNNIMPRKSLSVSITVSIVIFVTMLMSFCPYFYSHSFADEVDTPDPGTSKPGYQLVWQDEFNSYESGANLDPDTGLNLNNWAYQLGDGTMDSEIAYWGNAELQCYTKTQNNIKVENGALKITAIREGTPIQVYDNESAKDYSSARIRTTDKTNALFSVTYGYVEARMKLPTEAGAWPAFWMLPQNPGLYSGWPSSGEIDIMESVGCKNNQVTGNAHWGTPNHMYQGSGWKTLGSTIDKWHIYAVNWEPGKIEWIYDGDIVYTLSNWTDYLNNASGYLTYDAPFDQPFYLLLDLAVDSGTFGGTSNDARNNVNFKSSGQNVSLEVDYVRAYQKISGYTQVTGNPSEPNQQTDWANYANTPQIATITADNLVSVAQDQDVDHDDASCTEGRWHIALPSGNGGKGTLSSYVDPNAKTWAKCEITNQGNLDYSYQLIGHFDAKAGYAYKMSFDAYAEGGMVGKTIYCNAKETVGWSSFASLPTYLTDKPTHYSIGFYQPTDFAHCRMEFNMGAVGTGKVYISNVSLEIIDPSTWRDVAGDKHVMPGGEYIYNGSFDQGINRLSNWIVSPGTTAKVQSFTTRDLTGHDVYVVDTASKTNYERITDGKKYYERRAEISAAPGIAPKIYQAGLNIPHGSYVCTFDMYSETDSAVRAQLYSTKYVNGQLVFDTELGNRVFQYKKSDNPGVMPRGFEFDVTGDYENIAAVFTFQKGTKVALDNVHLIIKPTAQEGNYIPINAPGWKADNGHGGTLPADSLKLAGALTDSIELKNIVSGDTWYAWQLLSPVFKIENAYAYKLKFKYKMKNSNNKFQILLQRDGSPWTVSLQNKWITYDSGNGDENEFATYEIVFHSIAAVDNCHLIFGFGNSEMRSDNPGSFELKDISLLPHYSDHALLEVDDHDKVDPSVFEDDPRKETDSSDSDSNITKPVANITPVPSRNVSVGNKKNTFAGDTAEEVGAIVSDRKDEKEKIETSDSLNDKDEVNENTDKDEEDDFINNPVKQNEETADKVNYFLDNIIWWSLLLIIIVGLIIFIDYRRIKRNKDDQE